MSDEITQAAPTQEFADETLICRECGKEFVFTAGEQQFYAEKGFRNKPRTCRECRAARRNGEKPPREYFTAVCADCGAEAKLTFQPSSDRPVYCSACYERRRQARQGRDETGE